MENQGIENIFKGAREASYLLNSIDSRKIDDVIKQLAGRIALAMPLILEANGKDLALMDRGNPKYDRLLLNEKRLEGIASDLLNVATLPSPLGVGLEERTTGSGLHIRKVTVPLGVVGIIYEARPNVTFDVFSLCLKAGNACILKGGGDAWNSNKCIADLIRTVLTDNGLPAEVITLLPPDREAATALLSATGIVDLIIPRGSQSLIDFVRKNSRVPVIETGAGIVHTYFHSSGDKEKGRAVLLNAKTRRVSVCNALDCLIIDRTRLGDLPYLLGPMEEKNVHIFADNLSHGYLEGRYRADLLAAAGPEHFGTEFLDYKMSVKTVNSAEEALDHIRQYSSKHSEAIIAEDETAIEQFFLRVDAAAVYANASTAFTDGAQFGLGAEIGISTQKLHARGPMGLRELTSYKWIVRGNGSIRNS